jgi:hypothetical protein
MNAFKHSFFIGNQGVDVYGHPISLFTILQFCRALEDTSSTMGSPIYTHSLITCISLMHFIIVLPLSTFVPNHSLIGNVFMTYICSCIFPRISIILDCQRFTPPSCRFFFLNHTLLGYQWHTTTIQITCMPSKHRLF